MQLLGWAPKSHLCDQRRRSKVTGLSDLMTLFIDLGCLYCKQKQRAFNVFKNTLNWLKIDSVDQKFNWLECGNFSQGAGTPGTERVIVFSQLAVKGLNNAWPWGQDHDVTCRHWRSCAQTKATENCLFSHSLVAFWVWESLSCLSDKACRMTCLLVVLFSLFPWMPS
jgi:hypothetical protein